MHIHILLNTLYIIKIIKQSLLKNGVLFGSRFELELRHNKNKRREGVVKLATPFLKLIVQISVKQ